MKKIFLFGAFVLVSAIGYTKELQTISDDFNCPEDCSGNTEKCCSTKSGTVFYGKCSC